jgi:hypothetical protein
MLAYRDGLLGLLLSVYFIHRISDLTFTPEKTVQMVFETHNLMTRPEDLRALQYWIDNDNIDQLCSEIAEDIYDDGVRQILFDFRTLDLESGAFGFRNRTFGFEFQGGRGHPHDEVPTSVGLASPSITFENFIEYCYSLRFNRRLTDVLIPHDLFFIILKSAVETGSDLRKPFYSRMINELGRSGFPHPFTIDNMLEWLHPKHYLDVEYMAAIRLTDEEQDLAKLIQKGAQSLEVYGTLIRSIMESSEITVAGKATVIRKLDEPNVISVKYPIEEQFQPLTKFQAFWAIGGDGGPHGSEYLSDWTRIGEWSGFIPGIPSRELRNLATLALTGLQGELNVSRENFWRDVSIVRDLCHLIASVPDPHVRIVKDFDEKFIALQFEEVKGRWTDGVKISYAIP